MKKPSAELAKKWMNSLSGFQGGNPGAEIWFCGIEFQDFNNDFHDAIENDRFFTPENTPSIDIVGKEHLDEPFNRGMIKLAEIYYGKTFSDHEKAQIFSRSSSIFKLNLYPIPQKKTSEDYSDEISGLLGIKSKDQLRELCSEKNGRFDSFKAVLNQHSSVRVIVCCSRMNLETYVAAFEARERVESTLLSLRKNNLKINGKNKYLSQCVLSSGVHLVVIPFLSGHPRYTLTSKNGEDLIWTGEFLNSLKRKSAA